MDNLIIRRIRFRAIWPVFAALLLILIIPVQPRHADAGEASRNKVGSANASPHLEDLTWISRLYCGIETLGKTDSIPRTRILEHVCRAWNDGIKNLPADSLSAPVTFIEKLLHLQTDHITSLLEQATSSRDTSNAGVEMRLDEAASAIKEVSAIPPLVLAARDSTRSSLLVISSVGCACEMERCSKMVDLFALMQADTLEGPIAIVDLMQAPVLEDLLGQVTIPYWILLNEHGDVSTLIEGASEAAEVRASVVSWLGLWRARSHKDK